MMEGEIVRAGGQYGAASLSTSPYARGAPEESEPLLRSRPPMASVGAAAILRRHRVFLVISAIAIVGIFVWAGMPIHMTASRSADVDAIEKTARSAARSDERVMLYVGTYTKDMPWVRGRGHGIHLFQLDPRDGSLHSHSVAVAGPNPTFVTGFQMNRRHIVYAVSEVSDFSLSATGARTGYVYAMAVGSSGELSIMNIMETGGARPCHLAISPNQDFLIASNYEGGSVTVFPINTFGSLLPPSDFHAFGGASHVDPIRQEAAHVPSSLWLNGETATSVLAADLGNDRIVQYVLDPTTGKLTTNPSVPYVARPPGSGPSGMLLHPLQPVAYVVDAFSSSIAAYRVNATTGSLEGDELQTISTVPKDFRGNSTAGALQLSSDAKFLYVSNLGHDSIAMFRIDPHDGKLHALGHEPSQGKTPHAILIYHNYLIVANRDSNDLHVFASDPKLGTLRYLNQSAHCGSPVGLFIAP